MEKLIIILLLAFSLHAVPLEIDTSALQHDCLACHQEQQIPSELVYKRYLLKYSTAARIEKAMFHYLKHPRQEHSIMPSQFFLKFPMKTPILLDDTTLHNRIRAYIDRFDLKKKLIVEQ